MPPILRSLRSGGTVRPLQRSFHGQPKVPEDDVAYRTQQANPRLQTGAANPTPSVNRSADSSYWATKQAASNTNPAKPTPLATKLATQHRPKKVTKSRTKRMANHRRRHRKPRKQSLFQTMKTHLSGFAYDLTHYGDLEGSFGQRLHTICISQNRWKTLLCIIFFVLFLGLGTAGLVKHFRKSSGNISGGGRNLSSWFIDQSSNYY